MENDFFYLFIFLIFMSFLAVVGFFRILTLENEIRDLEQLNENYKAKIIDFTILYKEF